MTKPFKYSSDDHNFLIELTEKKKNELQQTKVGFRTYNLFTTSKHGHNSIE